MVKAQEDRYKTYKKFYKDKIYDVELTKLDRGMFRDSPTIDIFSNKKRQEIAAYLYGKSGTIARGTNSYRKSHPTQAKFGVNEHCIFLHAEIECLVRALRLEKSLNNKTILVKRIGKNKDLLNSFCCDGCYSAIKYYGIKYIVFWDSYYLELRKVKVV